MPGSAADTERLLLPGSLPCPAVPLCQWTPRAEPTPSPARPPDLPPCPKQGLGLLRRSRPGTWLLMPGLRSPESAAEMTVKVKFFYLFQERTRQVDLDILYETDKQTK